MNVLKRKELIDKIINSSYRDMVKILTGIRMSGKTTLIRSVMDELKNRGVNEENIVYISFKSMEYYKAKSYDVYRKIKDRLDAIDGKIYLFFDHVEEFEDWQFVVNGFRSRPSCDVTAAVNYSQFYTLGENHLGGRCIPIEIYPFSFKEFLQYKKEFSDDDKSVEEFFIEYMKYGGMPEVVGAEADEKYGLLKIICRIIRYGDFIKEIDCCSFLVNDFFRYMILTFGETFSKKEINKYSYDLFDDDILYSLLHNLETSSFMPSSNISYDGRRLNLQEKYYLADHGFFTSMMGYNHFSVENIIKNIIYIELLRRGYKVFFSQNREKYVDFICSGEKGLIFIQFDYIFSNETIIENEIDFLNSAAGNNEKYIITTGNYDFSEYGVRHLNIIDFLCGSEI